jgi:dienelactone hydrolase
MTLVPDQMLSHYRIAEKIGQGGMGVVWRAVDTRLDRDVAIKVLPPGLTDAAELRTRFEQEAKLAAAVSHPNIATVYDVGNEQGVTFMVMELIRGDTLRTRVTGGPMQVGETVHIATGIAAGLAHAHSAGVIHRDLKPDNVALTADGVPKILDFGLGKLVQETRGQELNQLSQAATVTPDVTRQGQVVGTLDYMSPEQLQSQVVDGRSDVFSFGVMLWEMLSSKAPFHGESGLDTVTAILRDAPPPLSEIRHDVPRELETILRRCLEKDPANRYASGSDLHTALATLGSGLAAPSTGISTAIRRPRVLIPVSLIVLMFVALAGWAGLRASKANWARTTLLPEVERLGHSGDPDAAVNLLEEAARYIPDDPRIQQLRTRLTIPLSLDTDPPGAQIFIRAYGAPERPWRLLGTAPLTEIPVPFTALLFKVSKPGYTPFLGAASPDVQMHFELVPSDQGPAEMVRVPAGGTGFGGAETVQLEPFWLDRHEITNAQYKEFIDAGGYQDPTYWTEPILDEAGLEIPRQEARQRFQDSTGRPGPSGWAVGNYPTNEADHPVGGVSWYEAAAYASWAGKSLPTVFHWQRAAELSYFSDILTASNFDGQGPAPVGSYQGIGPFGTYDMAGNVREWCLNRVADHRYLLGGTWKEPLYMYGQQTAVHPLDRSPGNGLRCMKTDAPPAEAALAPVTEPVYDFSQVVPVDDEIFQVLRGMFAYDPVDLDPLVESTDDSEEDWRKEAVSFRAAYGNERIPAYIYLPRQGNPPYQAVIYAPGGAALELNSSGELRLQLAEFLPRSGRAVIYPIYQGTYERRLETEGINAWRDQMVQMGKDIRRTIDYLETRDDIDTGKLAYYGLSFGANYGPIFTAVEDRFATSILISGGLQSSYLVRPEEIKPQNFAPRSTLPVLMINGRNDFLLPVETSVRPSFSLQGAPAEDKSLVLLEGGHIPSQNDIIREVLDWLDRYLGPVTIQPTGQDQPH